MHAFKLLAAVLLSTPLALAAVHDYADPAISVNGVASKVKRDPRPPQVNPTVTNLPTDVPDEAFDTSGRIIPLELTHKEHQKPGVGQAMDAGVDPGSTTGAAAMVIIMVGFTAALWMASSREEEPWDRRVIQ